MRSRARQKMNSRPLFVLAGLENEVVNDFCLVPNPAKQERRYVKKYVHALDHCRQKNQEYQPQNEIAGNRNSYSKTDHDATFMRLKEDPMSNGQN